MWEMSKKFIAIIDYKLGNLFSIKEAIRAAGAEAEIISDPESLKNFDAAILPGVGAFGEAMDKLRSSHFDNAVKNYLQTGKHLLGICLGLQILFDSSEEFGSHKGLGYIPGTVKKFPTHDTDGSIVNVPHVGWNTASTTETGRHHQVFSKCGSNTSYYFVHSFYASVPDQKYVVLESEYAGIKYASAVARENILAVQFHPEKSGPAGIRLLTNWISHK